MDNPFGKSPVLLAFEGNMLVGVRAFMRWEWRQGDRIYKAVRAVDTATHPEHQGKGIFKTLTLQLVEQCRAEGVDFIFNTPNKSSKPGYLKMGWQEAGRLPISFCPYVSFAPVSPAADPAWNQVEALLALTPAQPLNYLHTAVSPAYLLWRYQQSPNVSYRVVGGDADAPFLLFYRLIKGRTMKEVRVVDYFGGANLFSTALRSLKGRERGIGILTAGANLPGAVFVILPVGPKVTVFRLTTSAPACNFNSWSPGLGDMELF